MVHLLYKRSKRFPPSGETGSARSARSARPLFRGPRFVLPAEAPPLAVRVALLSNRNPAPRWGGPRTIADRRGPGRTPIANPGPRPLRRSRTRVLQVSVATGPASRRRSRCDGTGQATKQTHTHSRGPTGGPGTPPRRPTAHPDGEQAINHTGVPIATEKKNNDLPGKAFSKDDGFRELPSPYVAIARSCGILILDNRSRMGFLESAHRRRVSRRQTAVGLGPWTKFVVFSPLLSEAGDEQGISLSGLIGSI